MASTLTPATPVTPVEPVEPVQPVAQPVEQPAPPKPVESDSSTGLAGNNTDTPELPPVDAPVAPAAQDQADKPVNAPSYEPDFKNTKVQTSNQDVQTDVGRVLVTGNISSDGTARITNLASTSLGGDGSQFAVVTPSEQTTPDAQPRRGARVGLASFGGSKKSAAAKDGKTTATNSAEQKDDCKKFEDFYKREDYTEKQWEELRRRYPDGRVCEVEHEPRRLLTEPQKATVKKK